MAWAVELSKEAFRDLSKLEKADAERVVKKLEEAAVDPFHFFTRLVGYDDFKLRAGDHRVFAVFLHDKKVIFVERIGHRKNVYKK